MSLANSQPLLGGRESARPLPWASLGLVAAAVLLIPCESISAWLQYDRAAIDAGQLWRLLTCHFTHWSISHLFWDAATLALLGILIERFNRRRLLVCLGLSMLLIPAAVYVGLPALATYRGLSGLDSALFVLLAVLLMRRFRNDGARLGTMVCLAMLAGFAAKTVFELASGSTLFVHDATCPMIPVPWAHVVGGLVGAACGCHARQAPAPRLGCP